MVRGFRGLHGSRFPVSGFPVRGSGFSRFGVLGSGFCDRISCFWVSHSGSSFRVFVIGVFRVMCFRFSVSGFSGFWV